MMDQVTAVILTWNEAPNIGRTLAALSWVRDIVVVDSLSDDATASIVRAIPGARLFERRFDTHQRQWTFALEETSIATDWVLALDADYLVPETLAREIAELCPGPGLGGYRARFNYCIEGRRLRGAVYPPVTVLFRRAGAKYVQDGHTQRIDIPGHIETLRTPIDHDDRKPLQRWMQSQIGYMKLEAEKLASTPASRMTLPDRLRKMIVVAPLAMLFYCLFVRGNILDGKAGLYYAMQRTVAEAILSLFLLDRLVRKAGDAR
jgi:glycosyltransferase involved in cell wall biosynthesis